MHTLSDMIGRSLFRRILRTAALYAALLTGASVAHAGEVAILTSADRAYYNNTVEGFRAALPPNTVVKEYTLGGDLSAGREIGAMLRADPPDVVFAVGLKATLAAKLELPDTPVVFSQVLEPESYQLPTKHMTGIRVVVPADQQLSTLHALVPRAQRVGLLTGGEAPSSFLAGAEKAARHLGLTLVPATVGSASDVPKALETLLPLIDVLWIIQDRITVTETTVPVFLKTLLNAKIPIVTFSDSLIRQGALGGLVLQPHALGQQAGALAARLLRGEQKLLGSLFDPEQPQLALNLHVARYLGLAPSGDLVRMATALYGTDPVAQHPTRDPNAR